MHLDIKPEHVHIGTDDAAYLLDFDIAEPIGRKTLMSGTRNFMAPEQFRFSERVPENDVYGFGVLAYTMLTGTTPINPDNKSLESFRQAHEQMRPPSFTEILTAKYNLTKEQIPATLLRMEPIIQRCLEKDVHKRPPSVKAILTALDDAYYEGAVDDRQKSTSTNTFRAVPALGQDILNDTEIAATIARTKRYEEIQEAPQTLAYTSKETKVEVVEGPVCWLEGEFAVSENVKSPEFYAGAVEQLNKLYQEFRQRALENIRATFATDTMQDNETAAARDSWATTIAERQALKGVRRVAQRQFNLNLSDILPEDDTPIDIPEPRADKDNGHTLVSNTVEKEVVTIRAVIEDYISRIPHLRRIRGMALDIRDLRNTVDSSDEPEKTKRQIAGKEYKVTELIEKIHDSIDPEYREELFDYLINLTDPNYHPIPESHNLAPTPPVTVNDTVDPTIRAKEEEEERHKEFNRVRKALALDNLGKQESRLVYDSYQKYLEQRPENEMEAMRLNAIYATRAKNREIKQIFSHPEKVDNRFQSIKLEEIALSIQTALEKDDVTGALDAEHHLDDRFAALKRRGFSDHLLKRRREILDKKYAAEKIRAHEENILRYLQ